ncbi:hypothetical protein ACWGH7_24050 [Streptomyces cyaneofuscatus]|uniref:hypothetical protein n=1 Tax=Streptomyces TaxID=1883 RepID=UPI001AF556BF|nr:MULTISPECIES: hypothetical protein [unclassified Streptomyces]CAD5922420.1 protein of unknown function [Streptomyces sp. KY75]CAD5990908.1 protein of unknown function [Streptomyces sp. KY70]
MRPSLASRLDDLLRPRGPTGRVLVTGWFSFLDGEVTAGDALARRAVSAALHRLGIAHATAWSPAFAPGELTLEAALPSAYEQLLFVCGPVHGGAAHGPAPPLRLLSARRRRGEGGGAGPAGRRRVPPHRGARRTGQRPVAGPRHRRADDVRHAGGGGGSDVRAR